MEGFEITNYLKTKIMPRRTEVNAEEIHGKGMWFCTSKIVIFLN